MKKILCAILFFGITSASAGERQLARATSPGSTPVSQESGSSDPARSNLNTLSVEILGKAAFYSVNFDRMIGDSFALGAGMAYLPLRTTSVFIVPLYANAYLVGGTNRFYVTGAFDIGIRTSSDYDSDTLARTDSAPLFGVGYEHRSPSGFLFRVGPYLVVAERTRGSFDSNTQITTTTKEHFLFPWLGISFGAAF